MPDVETRAVEHFKRTGLLLAEDGAGAAVAAFLAANNGRPDDRASDSIAGP